MTTPPDLFNRIRDSVIAWDHAGRICAWNPAAAALYGYDAVWAIGRKVEEVLGGVPEANLAEAVVERRGAGGRALLVEASWSRRSGETLEIGRDITTRRTMEDQLKRSELRYSSLFQAMAAAFWELDFSPVGKLLGELKAQGVADLPRHFDEHPEVVREMMRRTRVVDVNDTTLAMFGIGAREHLARSVEPYWPEVSSGVYAAAVKAAISHKSHYMSETRLRRRDGSEFDALFTAAFPHEGLVQGALLVGVIDISERLAAEAGLRRLQDEFAHGARVSMLGELAASIAHEVNQPLAAISTNAAASLRWMRRAEPDVDQALKLTERIVSDAQRAGDIISRIRTMATNRPADPAIMPINGVIEEAMLFLHHEFQAYGVTPVLALGEALPDVCADRTQVQQVFVNLAVNAIQSMAHAGTARPEIRIESTTDASGALRIVVADNGPGLGAPALAHLFDSFFTTKATGMGMGLPICRTILEAFGGTISALNAPDGGAVFTLTLPAAIAPDA